MIQFTPSLGDKTAPTVTLGLLNDTGATADNSVDATLTGTVVYADDDVEDMVVSFYDDETARAPSNLVGTTAVDADGNFLFRPESLTDAVSGASGTIDIWAEVAVRTPLMSPTDVPFKGTRTTASPT